MRQYRSHAFDTASGGLRHGQPRRRDLPPDPTSQVNGVQPLCQAYELPQASAGTRSQPGQWRPSQYSSVSSPASLPPPQSNPSVYERAAQHRPSTPRPTDLNDPSILDIDIGLPQNDGRTGGIAPFGESYSQEWSYVSGDRREIECNSSWAAPEDCHDEESSQEEYMGTHQDYMDQGVRSPPNSMCELVSGMGASSAYSWNTPFGVETFGDFADNNAVLASGDQAQDTRAHEAGSWNFGLTQQYPDQRTNLTENFDGLDPSLITEDMRLQNEQFSADADSTLRRNNGANMTPDLFAFTSSGGGYQLDDAQRYPNSSASSLSRSGPLSSAVPRSIPNVSFGGHGHQVYFANDVDSMLDLEPLTAFGLPSAPVSQPQSHSAQPHTLFTSESEIICPECEADPACKRKVFKGPNRKNTLGKHILNQHSGRQFERYECSLPGESGSPCLELIKSAQNRRRHVDDKHPTEAHGLPPTDASKRRPNDVANAKLAGWFKKVSIEE